MNLGPCLVQGTCNILTGLPLNRTIYILNDRSPVRGVALVEKESRNRKQSPVGRRLGTAVHSSNPSTVYKFSG
jgi:hypothetical protein